MSIHVMSWVWKNAPLDGTDLLVLLCIADHADEHGENAWPSVQTIARYARRKPRRVQQIVRDLESAGLIAVELQKGGTADMPADRRPNRYRVIMDDGVQSPPGSDPAGCSPEPGGVQSEPPRGATQTAPNPSMEPSMNRNDRTPARASTSTSVVSADSAEFIAFWLRYPRKVGKPKAVAAFDRAMKRASVGRGRAEGLNAIMAGLDAHVDAWPPKGHPDAQFIPHATTWLNRDGWEDEPPSRKGARRSSLDVLDSLGE